MPTSRAVKQSLDLEQTFTHARMKRAWKEVVRTGLRNQMVTDLHDYLDVHRNIDGYIEQVREKVVAGRYRPGTAEVVRLEKGIGISRRLLIPSPADALLLQTLVETFQGALLVHQPNKNAYYSRSHKVPSVEDVDESFPYPWWLLWPQFQSRIMAFTESFPHVVIADVANYFDSIPLASLRNVIASMGPFNENLLDFLFFMLEAFTWRPYYMPFSGVGLPQIDFDAPRLLAHIYLFAADKELQTATNGNFVRWMDDVDFGVHSETEARRILGNLDTLLNSYGIRLNVGKTKILSAPEAARHFWVQENRALTIVKNLIESRKTDHPSGMQVADYLRSRCQGFLGRLRAGEREGQWEKVMKRYLGLLGKLKDDVLMIEVPEILQSVPGVREEALRYYRLLGFSDERYSHVAEYLTSGKCVDDASLFDAVRTIVEWRIPNQSAVLGDILSLPARIIRQCESRETAFIGGLWLLSKYGRSEAVERHLDENRGIWTKSEWVARQVAAATPRLSSPSRTIIITLFTVNGLTEALGVAAHYGQLKRLPQLDKQLRAYLMVGPSAKTAYPLPKVLLGMALLDGEGLSQEAKRQLADALRTLMDDPNYRALLHRPEPAAVVEVVREEAPAPGSTPQLPRI